MTDASSNPSNSNLPDPPALDRLFALPEIQTLVHQRDLPSLEQMVEWAAPCAADLTVAHAEELREQAKRPELRGSTAAALCNLLAALVFFRTGEKSSAAWTYWKVSTAYRHRGDLENAERCLARAVEQAEGLDESSLNDGNVPDAVLRALERKRQAK